MRRCVLGLTALVVLLACHPTTASVVLESYQFGAQLSDTPDYEWWHGCSPTSAGMLLAYYDINGYDGLDYSDLIAGGVAELSTFGVSSAIANDAIASSEHIADFYGAGYLGSGDDITPSHEFNCLADFMGTSQDAAGNVNGGTTFYYYSNGAPFGLADAVSQSVEDRSGMYGIYEYILYCGYSVATLFNQYTDNRDEDGFTYDDFKNEIDAGRPVLIHVEGHTMLGYGYDETGSDLIYVRDTWTSGEHTMIWGGSYSGSSLFLVTALELSGGEPVLVPEPSSILVWSLLGCMGMVVGYRRRRRE